MKNRIKTVILCLLPPALCALLFLGGPVREGVRYGLSLAYTAVIPALFPSMILCGIIGEYAECIPLPPAVTVWTVSQLCGFPLGVRTVAAAYRRGLFDRDQAVRLSACCSNASPAFLILYAGETLLGSRAAGIRLYAAQVILSAWIGLALNAFSGSKGQRPPGKPFLRAVTDSVAAAASGCLILTAYIAAFSVFGAFLDRAPFFYALLEITGGLSRMDLANRDLFAAAAGFSGLSVMMQNGGYLIEAELPVWPVFRAKTLYALLLPLICRCLPGAFWALIPPFFVFFFDKRRKKQYNDKKRRTGAFL